MCIYHFDLSISDNMIHIFSSEYKIIIKNNVFVNFGLHCLRGRPSSIICLYLYMFVSMNIQTGSEKGNCIIVLLLTA